ncbi:MAG: alkaline phosphatase, partial [Promethearchaeota archaeon]
KTNNGMLALSPLLEPLETIVEIAHQLGKSTGIITTTAITHATPAAFMTHVKSRSNTSEISRQIVENSNVSVLLGGGRNYFSASQISQLKMDGYHLLENRSQLISINFSNLIGLFAPNHLPYEIERNAELIPSLSEMTTKALEILSQDPEGFFLLVEGGRIDHGGHENNKTNVALETIEFNYAVNKAISYAKLNDNILLLITADHETGGLTVLNDTLTNYIPSPGNAPQENKKIRIERINNISVSWTTTGHTNKDVPLFGYKTDFYEFNNLTIIDNTDIFQIMKSYFFITLKDDSDYLIPLLLGVVIGGSATSILIMIYLRKKRKN